MVKCDLCKDKEATKKVHIDGGELCDMCENCYLKLEEIFLEAQAEIKMDTCTIKNE
jgi:hypothetical protein